MVQQLPSPSSSKTSNALDGSSETSVSFQDRTLGYAQSAISVQSQASELLAILGRHWKLFTIIFLVISITGTAVVLQLPKTYAATTTVLFDPRNRQIVNFTPVPGSASPDSEALEVEVATELELILSRRVTDPVIAQYNLLTDPEFSKVQLGMVRTALAWTAEHAAPLIADLTGKAISLPAEVPAVEPSAARMRQTTLKAFRERLRVEVQGHSTAIQVIFTSQSPEKSAAIANAIAANYVQLAVTDKAAAMQYALTTLGQRLAELRAKVDGAESAVEEYRNSAHLVEGTHGDLASAQLSELSSEMVKAEGDLATAQSDLTKTDANTPGGAHAVLASPVIQLLRAQEARESSALAQDLSAHGNNYWSIEGHRSQLAAIRQQIGTEVANVMRATRTNVEGAQARVNLLRSRLADIWAQVGNSSIANVHLRQLRLEADVQRTLYESYLRRIQEISQQVGTAQPYAAVISSAEVPATPTAPNLGLLIPSIFLVAAAIGMANVVCAEIFDKTFRSLRQVAQVFGDTPVELVPCLTFWRRGRFKWFRRGGASTLAPDGTYAEAIHVLRVQLRNLGARNQTVLFSSAVANEGKTATAVAFARQEALSGMNVMMIDADLRRPSLHRVFGGTRAGLSEVLLENRPVEEVVQRDRVSGLAYLGAGYCRSPIDMLGGHKMRALLHDLEQSFDRIVIDSPPVLAVADARVLTAMVDRTMFVVRWASTPRHLARLGLEVLRLSGGRVFGPIFIRVDQPTAPYSMISHMSRPAV